MLTGPGTVSKQEADRHALGEYAKYRVIQDERFVSDFDRFARGVLESEQAGGDTQLGGPDG